MNDNVGNRHQGLFHFYEAERARILDACTGCGRCFEVCPMTPFLELQTAEGAAVVEHVLAVVDRRPPDPAEPAAEDALRWISGCTGSGLCIPACPVAVNPKMMLRIGRITALGGLGDAKLIDKPTDPNWFPRVLAYARLQLTDDERQEWM